MSTRLALAGGALAVTGLLTAVAPLATAAPKCSGTTGTTVHAVEGVVAGVPVAGTTAAGLVHGPVENTACKLP